MKLGCRWEQEPPCKRQVAEYRRIILDITPVTHLGLCRDHADVFDRAVTRGGIHVTEEVGKAVTVRAN